MKEDKDKLQSEYGEIALVYFKSGLDKYELRTFKWFDSYDASRVAASLEIYKMKGVVYEYRVRCGPDEQSLPDFEFGV